MKGCLIAVAIVFVLVAGGGVLIWINQDTIFSSITETMEQTMEQWPEYGKQEYIDQNFGELLRTLDAAAENGSSIMTFGAAVEGMTLPEEVLYVGIYKEEDKKDIGVNKGEDKIDVFKRFDLGGLSRFTMGGYGYGTLGKDDERKDIIIYMNEGPWSYMDKFVVYIEYTGGTQGSTFE